jgi:hypothetical protein
MLDFRSWLLFTEAPSDYTWIEKDPEDYEKEIADYEAELEVWKKSPPDDRSAPGERPSPYKRVRFDDLEERVPKGSGSYRLVDKDPEDYEAELAAFNKDVEEKNLDRSKLSYYDPLSGREYNKPYPYKKIPYVAPARKKKPKTAEEIAYDAAEKEASKYRTKEQNEKIKELRARARAKARAKEVAAMREKRQASKIKSKQIASNPFAASSKDIDKEIMPQLGLFNIENGKRVLADDSVTNMIRNICRQSKRALGNRGKVVDLEELTHDTIVTMHIWPSGILNYTRRKEAEKGQELGEIIPGTGSEQFHNVKAMQNTDGTLSKEDQSKVMAMIGSQAKKWSLYVGYKTTIFGKNWKTRNDAEEEEQAEEFAEKVKKKNGQVTFEAIPTDEKTKRQIDIEKDNRSVILSGIVGSPAKRMLGLNKDQEDFSKELLKYFRNKDDDKSLLQHVRELFNKIKKDARGAKIPNQKEFQSILDSAQVLFALQKVKGTQETAERVEELSEVQPETYKNERQKILTRNLIGTSREPIVRKTTPEGGVEEEEYIYPEPDEKLEKNVLSIIDDKIAKSKPGNKEKWKKIKKVAFYVIDGEHRWNKKRVAEFLGIKEDSAGKYIEDIREIAKEVAIHPKGLGLAEPSDNERIIQLSQWPPSESEEIESEKIPLTPFQRAFAVGKIDPRLKRLVRHVKIKGKGYSRLPGDFAQERMGTTPQQVARREVSDQEKKIMADDTLRKINKLYKLDQERIKKQQLPLFVVDQFASSYNNSRKYSRAPLTVGKFDAESVRKNYLGDYHSLATAIDPGEQHTSSVASIKLWKAQSELSYAKQTLDSYENKMKELWPLGFRSKENEYGDPEIFKKIQKIRDHYIKLSKPRDEMKNQVANLEKEIKKLKLLTDKEFSLPGIIKRSELTDPVETPFLVKYDNDPEASPYASNKGMAGKKPLGRLKALRDILNKANDPRLDSEEVKKDFNAPLPRAMPGERLQSLPVGRWTMHGPTSNAYLTGLRPSQIGIDAGKEFMNKYVTGMQGMAPGEKYYPYPATDPKSRYVTGPDSTTDDNRLAPEITGSREYMNWNKNRIKPVAPVAPVAPVVAKRRGRPPNKPKVESTGNGWISLSEHMARRRFAF